jgi:hypothetical protein
MRVLYNAVESKERAIAGCDGIIITYNKKTSTGGWVACLGRRESDLQSFGIFSKPKIVRPDGAKAFAQSSFDFPMFC